MSNITYRIILEGYLPGKGEFYIEEDFAKVAQIPLEKARALFKSCPVKLTEGLSEADTEKYIAIMKKVGAKCAKEDMRNSFDLDHLSVV